MKRNDLKHFLLKYLKPNLKNILLGVVLMLVVSVATVFTPLILRKIIDDGILKNDFPLILRFSFFYFAIHIFIMLVSFINSIMLEKTGQRIIISLKKDTYESILKKRISYFSENTEGTLISRVESDGESIRQIFTANTITLLSNIVMLLGMCIIMYMIDRKLFLYLMIFIIPVFLTIVAVYSKYARPKFLILRKKIAALSSFLVEYFKGMEIVKVFNRVDFLRKYMHKLNLDYYRSGFNAESLHIYFYNSVTMLQIFGFAIILWFGGRSVLAGTATFGTLVLFINYIRQLFGPIIELSNQISFIERAKASIIRLNEIQKSDDNPEYRGTGTFNTFKSIKFENVNYSYDKVKGCLKNIDLSIEKGQRVAFVGRTGGGKTSIIKLILKLLVPDSGNIIVNGINLNEIDTFDWRKKIGYISQDIFLFPGTIMDNIKLSDESITEKAVIEASARTGLIKFINKFQKGFDTVVSEGGKNFSKGQRQLINITRAIINNPCILIMDEATSSIDAKYESDIMEIVSGLSDEITIISIAHRISTIKNADTIYFIDGGKIIDKGNHNDLINKNSIYGVYNRIIAGELN